MARSVPRGRCWVREKFDDGYVVSSAEGLVTSSMPGRYHPLMIAMNEMIHHYDRLRDAELACLSLIRPLDAVMGTIGSANSTNSGGCLLCLDEFQIADVAEARSMHGIFHRLMQFGTLVFLTSNGAPAMSTDRNCEMGIEYRVWTSYTSDANSWKSKSTWIIAKDCPERILFIRNDIFQSIIIPVCRMLDPTSQVSIGIMPNLVPFLWHTEENVWINEGRWVLQPYTAAQLD